MKFFSFGTLFKLGVRGAMVTASMIAKLILVFFTNSLLKIENTEHVFFIFRFVVVASSMGAVKVLMFQKTNGELSEKHKKNINKIYIYLVVFYLVNELLIMWGGK